MRTARISWPVRARTATALLALLLCYLSGSTAASAAGGAPEGRAWWKLDSTSAPALLPRHGPVQIIVSATDIGDREVDATGEAVTLSDELPAGVTPTGVEALTYGFNANEENERPTCSVKQKVVCNFSGKLAPFEPLSVRIIAEANEPQAPLRDVVAVSGGHTSAAGPIEKPLRLQAHEGESTPFGVESYELRPETEDGSTDTQAGSHPYQLTTTLDLNQTLSDYDTGVEKGLFPSAPALPQNLHFKLPPGLVASTTTVPRCSDAQFSKLIPGSRNLCAPETAIGAVTVLINLPNLLALEYLTVPLFNLTPAPGEPARFGFEVENVSVVLDTALPAGGDYAAEVSTSNTTQAGQLLSSQVTIWGAPGDKRHDQSRGWQCIAAGFRERGQEVPCVPLHEQAPRAFLTLPTYCSHALTTSVSGNSWPTGEPGNTGSVLAEENAVDEILPHLTGCDQLGFDPSITAKPEVETASTPSGLTIGLHMPQESLLTEQGNAESAVKGTTIELPEGLQASPAAAGALLTCSGFQLGLAPGVGEDLTTLTEDDHFSSGPAACPEQAKIGTVSVTTPLLAGTLEGGVYLASQNTNPFASPLILYLVAEEPTAGVRVKLAGEVRIDPSTGRLTSEFKETPALPFSDLIVQLFGGPRAAQSTPPLCGEYAVDAQLTPWSGAPAAAISSDPREFVIDHGAGGGPCQSTQPLTFSPSFSAGAKKTQAAALTPFTVTVGHADSDQPLQSIGVTLPAGVGALISQVSPCPEARALADACDPASLVGHTTALSGLGGEPVSLPGSLYLTGPLKATAAHPAAPFGLLAVTHAAVGPFDLGIVTVLSTIAVNPSTAAVTVQSEPIPKILDGVPVQLKQLDVTVERPGGLAFQYNPSDCDPLSVAASLGGWEGAVAGINYPFNVGNCATLPFHPILEASTAGQASRVNGASLTVKVHSVGLGQANIAKVDLQLPKTLPSRQSTIKQACPEATFNANPATCDDGSVIGSATVHTPIFLNPLVGPGYLVSHGGAGFPDVEFVLQGEGIKLVLDGHTDIKKGITYSRFESVPDAPFTSFDTVLPQGPHSALGAYLPTGGYNLCGHSLSMPTTITGQNGVRIEQATKIALTGCRGVAGFKSKKLTRAQKLKRALVACRKRYRHAHRKQAKCEAHARASYRARVSQHTRRRR
jgi:hypothetical protein